MHSVELEKSTAAAPRLQPRKASAFLWPLCVLILALVSTFHPTLFSGFSKTQTDLGDSRFNALVLEHSWRWLTGDAMNRSLWDLPIAFPAQNTLAYSDSNLSFAPPYWLARAAGLPPFVSFSLWEMTVAAVGYAVGYAFLRRYFRFAPAPSAIGACLMAFGAPLIAMLAHQQLLPQFYVIGYVWSVFTWVQPDAAPARSRAALLAASASFVGQLYGGFYMAYFLWLFTVLAVLVALVSTPLRRRLLALARANWRSLAIAVLAVLIAAIPWLRHYLAVARLVGMRDPVDTYPLLPTLYSWLMLSPGNPFYRWMYLLPRPRELADSCEHFLCLGFVTTGAAVAGLWRLRSRAFVSIFAVLLAIAFLGTTAFPGHHSLWKYLCYTVPGLGAIRAPGRFVLLLLVPAGIGLAQLITAARTARAKAVVSVVIALCALEQYQQTGAFDNATAAARVAAITTRVDHDRLAFVVFPEGGKFLDPARELDAMWAAMESGVPTVNLYSGNVPPGWPFTPYYAVRVPAYNTERQVTARLNRWLDRNNLPHDKIQQLPPAPLQQ